MADIKKTSGPITVERNTTITDVKGQKHTGLKQKTVVDAEQKALISFSVGSTTKLQVVKTEDGKTYVSFDASLFTTRDGKIPPAFKIGNTCMLEVTKTGENSPVSIDFSKDETKMTIKSSDGQEYTLFVHAGGAKLEMGEGDSRQVFTYNSTNEKGEVVPLDASVSTECIERLCDQNDQLFAMPGPATSSGVAKVKAQLPPYYIALAYCKAKGIKYDPTKTMTTLIESDDEKSKGVSYFVYTPPTAENNQNAVNPLILAKTPDNRICFYHDGNWLIADQYFFQTATNGSLYLYFNITPNNKRSYEYALNTGAFDKFTASTNENDRAKQDAIKELVGFIESGVTKDENQHIRNVNKESNTTYTFDNGLVIKPAGHDDSQNTPVKLNQKLNNLSATQEETGGIEPPPPPGPTRTPLKKVTEQKKYGPLPGHITTILAIGLMMCSVLLGPIAGAVLASIGALAFIGGQSYLMLLDYLNDPLHAIRTKYIDPLTEQEREFENEQIDFWENEQAINKNIEEAQGLVAAFDEMWGENKPPFYGQGFGYTQDNAKDFVVPPTWDGFISEENMQQRFDMIRAYQGLINKGEALEEKDINEFIRKHVYTGSDKEVVKKIQSQLFVNVSKAKIQESEITSFQKDGKHILYGESLGITDKNQGEFKIPLTLDEFNADGNKDNREKFQTAYKALIGKGNTLEEKDINEFIREHIYTGNDQTIVETIRSRFFDSSLRPKIPQAQISAFSEFNQKQKDNLAERQGLMDKQRKILVNGDKRIINATIFDKKLTPEQRLQRVQRYAKGIMERFITESDMGTEDFTAFLSSFPENERGLVAEILSKAQNEVEIEIELENKNFKNGKADRKRYAALTTIFSQLGKMEDDIRAVFRGLSSTISEDTLQRNKETLNVATAKSKLTQQRDLLDEKIKSMLTRASLSALSEEDQKHVKDFITSLTPFEDDTKKEIANLIIEREELLAQTSFYSDIEIAKEKYSTGKDWIEMPHAPSYAFSEIDLKSSTSFQVDHFVHGQMASYLAKTKGLSLDDCQKMSTDKIIKALNDVELPKEMQLLKNLHEKNTEIKSKVDKRVSEKQTSLEETSSPKAKTVADKKIEAIVREYLKTKYKSAKNPNFEKERRRLVAKITPIAYRYLATCDLNNELVKVKKTAIDFTPSLTDRFNALCQLCVSGEIDEITSTTLTMNATDMALDATNAKLRQMLTERFGAEKANDLMKEENAGKLQETLNDFAEKIEDYDRGIADRKKKITSLVKSRLSEEQLAPFVDKFVEELGAKDLSSIDSVLDFALKKMEESSVNMDNGHGAYVNKTIKEHFIEELKQTDKNFAKKMKELEKQPDSDERKKEIDEAIKYAVTHPTMSRQARKLETRKAAYALKAEEKAIHDKINRLFSTLEDDLSKVKGQPESQIHEIKKWLETNKDNLSGSDIFKDIGDKINEKDVAKIMSDVRKQLDEKRASLEKEVKKLYKKVKKSDKKVEKKKKKKQRKINREKSKAAQEALNAAKNAAAKKQAATATERERESGAEREAGAGRASESSEEMGS